jgi:chromosome segregation ATPase
LIRASREEDWDALQEELTQLKKVLAENEISLRVTGRQHDELKTSHLRLESELKERTSEVSGFQKQIVVHKDLLDLANREIDQLNDKISKREQQRQTSASEVDTLRLALLEKENEMIRLQSQQSQEVEARVSRMNDMIKKLTAESENNALAIQKAISSSVRLCVVAPTVNVHVADKKMKFRSKYVPSSSR